MADKKKPLVIVESRAKVRTISKILGSGYTVASCQGHLVDLPSSGLAVDVENGFEPQYEFIKEKSEVIDEIRELWKKAGDVYLACDPDREGEAISWFLKEYIGKALGDVKNLKRITFNEITKKAVLEAIENPRDINIELVEAQKARRILDRLVGYQISPILWVQTRYGLSAGRVQTVALKIICDREKEIRKFVPVPYFSISAELSKDSEVFGADLFKYMGEKIGSPNDKKVKVIGSKEEADEIINSIKKQEFKVKSVKVRTEKRNPPRPFITSTLQQAANNILGFSSRKTMSVAQRLYEGKDIGGGEVVGLITYMRTDSPRIAEEAISNIRWYIDNEYGEKYLHKEVRRYRAGREAQDAHEAIRPTSVNRTPDSIKKYISRDEYNLYKLIWSRTVAVQMAPAQVKRLTVEIEAGDGLFKATGAKIIFDGFFKVMPETRSEERELPDMKEGDIVALKKIEAKQHSTQPPPRYTEASLVRKMQEVGIGRPSTYAPTISVLLNRKYVTQEGRTLIPTDTGELVADMLVGSFKDIFKVKYTARMEEELDLIEEGKENWRDVLSKFNNELNRYLKGAEKRMEKIKKEKEVIVDYIKCDKCGSPMMIKYGKGGRFLGCSAYPNCKNQKPFKEENGKIVLLEELYKDERCDECGAQMVVKGGRFGIFLACSRYPECKFTKSIYYDTGVKCPREGCDGTLVEKKTKKRRTFYGCSNYPDCDYALWQKPVKAECPKCGAKFLVVKGRGSNKRLVCVTEGCGYETEYNGE
ncbi:MAG: type I DNA topoisomerase [Candidatus Coatesbacteria bacterium]|nr:MAG: type I DNA topoisomerase [Candidatus Coatesbacteria bacterium]